MAKYVHILDRLALVRRLVHCSAPICEVGIGARGSKDYPDIMWFCGVTV